MLPTVEVISPSQLLASMLVALAPPPTSTSTSTSTSTKQQGRRYWLTQKRRIPNQFHTQQTNKKKSKLIDCPSSFGLGDFPFSDREMVELSASFVLTDKLGVEMPPCFNPSPSVSLWFLLVALLLQLFCFPFTPLPSFLCQP